MMDKTKIESGFSSDAKKEPRRIVFITRNTSARVKDERERKVMSFPHLLVREAIVFEVLIIALVLVAIADINRPFQGSVHVSDYAFRRAQMDMKDQ